MKVSLNSVSKYTKIIISQEDIIDRVFKQIGAVEHMVNLEEKYKDIVVAQIKEKSDHPDADKLGVFKLDIGKGELLQVVAGDKSLEVGDKVALMLVGAKVPYNAHPEKNDGIISKVSLRGVESNGMMGSEKELDLGADHTKVMRLNSDAIVGNTFIDEYNLDDMVIDIENKALANRGDLFGMINVAREISAIQGMKFDTPEWLVNPLVVTEGEGIDIKVTNNAKSLCPRYMAVGMDAITVKQSPLWLRLELAKIGMRPISNIVDITNYMMYLTSQPLHAFDYDKILNKQKNKEYADIQIRMAKAGEQINVIDGKSVTLDDTMVVIADENDAIAIAGVMGGMDTEVDENTKRIVIECANFDRYNIRRTSMKTGIASDAVTRYTKAIDPNLCKFVIAKTVEMVNELAGGKVASSVVDVYDSPVVQKSIRFSVLSANTHLGTSFTKSEIEEILSRVNYIIEQDEPESISVTVPTLRQDVSIKEDVFEDIGRIHGYNTIGVSVPRRDITPIKANPLMKLKNDIRNILSSLGAHEVLTYNFVSKESFAKTNLDINDAYHLKNALSPELEYIRTSLVPSLIEKCELNYIHNERDFTLFEMNKVHNKSEMDEEGLPFERSILSIVTTQEQVDASSYYSVKAMIDQMLDELMVSAVTYRLVEDVDTKSLPSWVVKTLGIYNPKRSAICYSNNQVLGILGELSSNVLARYKVSRNVCALELDLSIILSSQTTYSRYIEPTKYPEVKQDLCFEVSYSLEYVNLLNALKESSVYNHIDVTIEPVDIFANDKEKKKITMRVTLLPKYNTLENSEISKIREEIVTKTLEKIEGKIV